MKRVQGTKPTRQMLAKGASPTYQESIETRSEALTELTMIHLKERDGATNVQLTELADLLTSRRN